MIHRLLSACDHGGAFRVGDCLAPQEPGIVADFPEDPIPLGLLHRRQSCPASNTGIGGVTCVAARSATPCASVSHTLATCPTTRFRTPAGVSIAGVSPPTSADW